MEKEWRELEILVEKIEKTIAPTDAIIKSPDFLIDRVTGEKREVDVSIRFDIGSANILIVIECRNRSHSQDVRWIEEVHTKHLDLGASKVIAVSKNGFTKQAIEKANYYKIELRTLDEINENFIKQWNQNLIVEVGTISYKFHSLKFKFEGNYDNVQPLINWANDPLKTIITKSGDEERSIESFIDERKLSEYIKKYPEEKQIGIIINVNGRGSIQTDFGPLVVLEMHIILDVILERNKINTSDIKRYRDISTNKIYEFGNYSLGEFPNGNITIQAYKKLDLDSEN